MKNMLGKYQTEVQTWISYLTGTCVRMLPGVPLKDAARDTGALVSVNDNNH